MKIKQKIRLDWQPFRGNVGSAALVGSSPNAGIRFTYSRIVGSGFDLGNRTRRRKLLEQFISLWQVTDEEILRLARKLGPLGGFLDIGPGRVVTGIPPEATGAGPNVVEALIDSLDIEPIDLWRAESAKICLLSNCWALTQLPTNMPPDQELTGKHRQVFLQGRAITWWEYQQQALAASVGALEYYESLSLRHPSPNASGWTIGTIFCASFRNWSTASRSPSQVEKLSSYHAFRNGSAQEFLRTIFPVAINDFLRSRYTGVDFRATWEPLHRQPYLQFRARTLQGTLYCCLLLEALEDDHRRTTCERCGDPLPIGCTARRRFCGKSKCQKYVRRQELKAPIATQEDPD